MGAAASLVSAGLPEKMNRADVQQLCDKKYSEEQFKAMCDSDGFITRQQFIDQVVAEQEEECRRLFVSFCRHDEKGVNTEEMDEEHLISFLRHCKLLNKNQFSIHDARQVCHSLIEEQVNAHDESNVHVVNALDNHGDVQRHVYVSYHMFREKILPVVAEKKGVPIDRILFLLSRCEASTRLVGGELVVTDSYDPANDESRNVERNVQVLVNEKDEERVKSGRITITQAELEKATQASKIIQNAARTKNARKERKNKLIIRQESAREVDDTCFCNEIYDDLEDRFRSKFAAFAARHSAEMDFKQFYRWLVDSGWFIEHKNFSRSDAETLFKIAMARASILAAGIDLNLGVVMNKRVRYNVFRKAVVKVLAEETNVNTNDVMYTLLDCDDPQ